MPNLKEITANIVAGFVANTKIGADEISSLIARVHEALGGLGKAEASEPASNVVKLTPGQIRKSVTDAGIVSFEDGKTYKSMKRSLTKYGLTPSAYREKWGLPKDYPMVAASYSASRSAMAKQFGLGNIARNAAAARRAKTAPETPSAAVVAANASRKPRPAKAAVGVAEQSPKPEPSMATTATPKAPKAPRKPRSPKAIAPSDDTFT